MEKRIQGLSCLATVVLLSAFLVAGCGSKSEETQEQTEAAEVAETMEVEAIVALTEAEEAMVQQIAAITKAAEKAPAAADAVLEQFGMTAEEYEAAVYTIAESASLSEAYEKAMGR